tara:strand:+ start:402 stop:866 length:465 start_codon:yes stop_codon:yes gene_type:complete
MGTIKADTLTGLSTASDVTIASNKFVGTASGTMTVVGEGGTTQTGLQQGLCKVWVNMDAGTTANDSHNVSGLTDVATGAHTITFSNNMASANYSPSMTGKEGVGETHSSSGVDRILNPTRVVFTTSDIKVTSINFSNQLRDLHTNTVNINGDLA